MAAPENCSWIHDVLYDAACVTAVTATPRDEVLAAFGADPAAEVPFDITDLPDTYGDEAGEDFFVSVLEVPGGIVAVEFNGYLGTLPEVLTALSAQGKAASMFWNVNDDNGFSCARHHELLARVDMYDAEDPDEVELPAELQSLFESARDEDSDLHATGLAMVEQFTGISVSQEHVAAIRTAYPAQRTLM